MPEDRRQFLCAVTGLPAAVAFGWSTRTRLEAAIQTVGDLTPQQVARDERFWVAIQQAFSLDARHAILNAGASDPMPRAVLDGLVRNTEFINASPLVNSRVLAPNRERVRQRLATLIRCEPEEIALTRGTTEGFNIVIAGLPLQRGDEIVTTDFDYHSVLDALRQRASRDGLVVTTVPMHWPESDQSAIVERFERALTSRTRVIVCSHITSGPGHIMPIARLSALARARNVRLVVDGALAFGHIVFDMPSLGCDYYATSLHKFLAGPLGTGFLFVRREHIATVWPLYGAPDPRSPDIRKFERIGTDSPAAMVGVGEALDFYESIGPAHKQARLHYLTHLWTEALTGVPRIRFLTSLDPAHSCAITHVIVEGVDAVRLASHLQDRHGLWVYGALRDRPELSGLFVAPNVFTRPADVLRLADQIARVARDGLAS